MDFRIEGDRLVDAKVESPKLCIHRRRLEVDPHYATRTPVCWACAWELERIKVRPA
jgi:hypothetical protein